MMILRNSPASPFGRKVRLAIAILGLDGEVKIEQAETGNPADTLRLQNPLGKIPVLIDADGMAVYDSPVILDYLDRCAGGGRIVPRDAKARLAALRLQALCDGVLDACILLVYEGRWRAKEHREQKWVDYQADKVARSLAAIEREPPGLDPMPDVGQIALACVLGYRDLRFEGSWRAGHPQLVAWLDAFAAKVPAFEATRFKG